MAKNHQSEFPEQHQEGQPGREHEMRPEPDYEPPHYHGSGKLKGRTAIITGGDSGIGRSVALLYAREGADVAIVYLEEHEDAEETKALVEGEGKRCLLISGDIGDKSVCERAVKETLDAYGRIDILVNNAAVQFVLDSLMEITPESLEQTFRTNVFGMFFMTQAVLPHLKEGNSIINTTSITAYKGNPQLIDYSATKGAIVAFTRALSQSLAEKNIRVNAVAPGPIWTPLIPATFPADQVKEFGQSTPLGRAGQPEEVAPCYVWLASDEASYITGQTLHPNGGQVVGG